MRAFHGLFRVAVESVSEITQASESVLAIQFKVSGRLRYRPTIRGPLSASSGHWAPHGGMLPRRHDHFPEAKRIVRVQDNLNTHSPALLYEAFPPAEARHLLTRFEIHFTPKHGSWLNIAEIELSALGRGCRDRRIRQVPPGKLVARTRSRSKRPIDRRRPCLPSTRAPLPLCLPSWLRALALKTRKQSPHPRRTKLRIGRQTMNKVNRCFLHLACIARKLPRGTPVRWHLNHLMREFGFGAYRKGATPRNPGI